MNKRKMAINEMRSEWRVGEGEGEGWRKRKAKIYAVG